MSEADLHRGLAQAASGRPHRVAERFDAGMRGEQVTKDIIAVRIRPDMRRLVAFPVRL